MWADTGGFFEGPFDHYEATPDAIEASAVELDGAYGNVDALSSDVDAAHRPALTGVAGTIAGPMTDAPQPMRLNARRVMTAAMVAAGSVRTFGHAVQDFDDGVDALNAQWRQAVANDFGIAPASYPQGATDAVMSRTDEVRADAVLDAKIALLKELELKYEDLRTRLDKQADQTAGRLSEGPTDQVIQQLFAAGGLPTMVVHAFPHLQLTANKLPPDLASLDEDEVEDYLRAHPEAAVVVNGLLVKDGLTDLEQAVVEAQGRIDGELLKQGMAKEPGDGALEDIAAAQARLRLINEHVAETGELNDAAHSYTFAYLNEVGSDNLAKLPDVVRDSVYSSAAGIPQNELDARMLDYLSPVSDAILNLSNEKLQTVTGEQGPGTTSFRYDFNGDGLLDKNDMPQAVRDLMSMRIGESVGGERSGGPPGGYVDPNSPTFDTITNLDKFNGWSDLLAASTRDGGHGFSIDLAEQAIQAKQDMNAILATAKSSQVPELNDWPPEQWNALVDKLDDAASSDLLSVASRNEDAASSLLIDDTRRQQILGINWDDGDGAGEVVRAGTDRDPNGGGGTPYQAEAALEVMTEVAADPKEYMERAANEAVSDAIVDVGITWIDTFGDNTGSDTPSTYNTADTDVLGRSLPLSVSLSEADQEGFLQFVANTGDEDAIRLEAAAHYYGQQLISGALDQDNPDVLRHALEWAGRADGQIRQANMAWAADELHDENATNRAQLLAENRSLAASNTAAQMAVNLAATAGEVIFPPAAPFLAVGATVVGPVIGDVLAQQEIPDFRSMEEDEANAALREEALDAPHRQSYFLAEVAIARDLVDDTDPRLFNEDGSLKTMQEIARITDRGNGLDELDDLAQKVVTDWNERHPDLENPADIDDFGEARSQTFPEVPPKVEKQKDVDRDWDDHSVAEENLYGDNVTDAYEEDGDHKSYPDENYEVDQPLGEKRPNDETTNDRRGDGPGK